MCAAAAHDARFCLPALDHMNEENQRWWRMLATAAVDSFTAGLPATTTPDTAVRALHREHKIYQEDCGHDHTEDDPGVLDITDVGLVCEEGYDYSICWECCTYGSGEQSQECAGGDHGATCWPCRTIRALDGSETGS
jgi:hypothetical protein